MSDNSTGTKDMRPHFEDIQAHYDLSDDFFGVFQDPTPSTAARTSRAPR